MIKFFSEVGNPKQREHPIIVIENEEDIDWLIKDLYREEREGGIVGIDCETTGVDPRSESPVNRGRIVCWSLATGRARYFLEPEHVEDSRLFVWLQTPYRKVGHNVFSFDRHIFRRHSIILDGLFDTRHMARFFRADKRFPVGLKHLMEVLFGYKIGDFKELFSRPSKGAVQQRDSIGHSKRKLGGRPVPTVLGLEAWNVSFKRQELIPLEDIKEHYPSRLRTLWDYATLDAKATRELYFELCTLLRRRACKIF